MVRLSPAPPSCQGLESSVMPYRTTGGRKFGTPFFIVDFTWKNWQNAKDYPHFKRGVNPHHGKQVEANFARR